MADGVFGPYRLYQAPVCGNPAVNNRLVCIIVKGKSREIVRSDSDASLTASLSENSTTMMREAALYLDEAAQAIKDGRKQITDYTFWGKGDGVTYGQVMKKVEERLMSPSPLGALSARGDISAHGITESDFINWLKDRKDNYTKKLAELTFCPSMPDEAPNVPLWNRLKSFVTRYQAPPVPAAHLVP